MVAIRASRSIALATSRLARHVAAALAVSLLALTAGQAGAQGTPPEPGSRGLGAMSEPLDLKVSAQRRYAIVVGNSDYQSVPDLKNAETDARAMTRYLRENGFRVDERFNLDRRGFENLMRRALIELGPDSEVLFYYAGHGIQIGRRNYLLPVDATLASIYDAPFETVTLDSLVKILGARSRLQLFLLDSCRDNPFVDAKVMTELDPTLFETGDGFGAMSAPVNSLLAYSTSPGATAFDGGDENSPFTGSFIRFAEADPGRSMIDLLASVRRDVYVRTNGQQVPWESSTLVEPFHLGQGTRAAGERVALASTPADPASLGQSRGLQRMSATLVSTSAVAGAASATTAPGQIAISAPLDRRISLGDALGTSLGLAPDASVSFATELTHGRLVLETAAATSDYRGQPIAAADLGTLVYEFFPKERPATGAIETYALGERLTATSGSTAKTIDLTLTPDACDHQAGDWLDPEGVGLARYPNEIDPDTAIQACQASVRASPQTGRFHYQLGRALQARVRYDEARAAFETARSLGHTRAYHALGDLIAEAASIEGGQADGRVADEALDFYRAGIDRGDPYAYHALGKQQLRYGRTDAIKRAGFDLLSQAIELGHTFAMNELGYYFLNEGSDHFEAQRGLRYLTASAERNDIYGYNNLGLVYDKGLGQIPSDARAALSWYTKAADGGHPYAPVNIGRMYFAGRLGNGPDAKRAIEWYDEGLSRGTAWGGANAAWIIANKRPRGFTPADAALRAAKAAALRSADAAKQANAILDGLNDRALNGAAQMIVRDFNPDQEVDGAIGPLTRQAIADLATRFGFDAPPDAPRARLMALAEIYWRAKGIRIDLL